VFQLGESGDGTHLLEAAGLSMAGDEYLGALTRFVAEEQEHARMLAAVLEALAGPLLSHHWSDRLFVLARRARSLVTEVLVLLIAEVVALTYYSTLRDGLPSSGLREVVARIHADELVHVVRRVLRDRNKVAGRLFGPDRRAT
jgi:rubrerythrin